MKRESKAQPDGEEKTAEERAAAQYPLERDQRERLWALPIFVTIDILSYLMLSLWVYIPTLARQRVWDSDWCFYNKIACNVMGGLTLYSYYLAFYIDPSVKEDYVVDLESGVTKCTKCGAQKEERTHHCSGCNRCIHRYDHHCDWIDNCVGRANHKVFVLFLLYISLVIFHYWYLLGSYVFHRNQDIPKFGATSSAAEIVTNIYTAFFSLIVIPMTFFSSGFFCCTSRLICQNKTTFESGYGTVSYDEGLYTNITHVMGNPLLWLVPQRMPDA